MRGSRKTDQRAFQLTREGFRGLIHCVLRTVRGSPSVSFPLIWALGFANAALLYGLAAASVPIIIHLLNRRKYREVTWAALRFLLAAIRKNPRRIRIEQLILLAP